MYLNMIMCHVFLGKCGKIVLASAAQIVSVAKYKIFGIMQSTKVVQNITMNYGDTVGENKIFESNKVRK